MYTVADINLLNFRDEKSIEYLQNTVDHLDQDQLYLLDIITKKISLKDEYGDHFVCKDNIFDLSAEYFADPFKFTMSFYLDNTDKSCQCSAEGLLIRSYFNLLFTIYDPRDLPKIKDYILENLRSI